MIQLRKDDYIQRIIQEFFAKLHRLTDKLEVSDSDKRAVLNECFDLYREYYHVDRSDSVIEIMNTLSHYELIEQYAWLLVREYEMVDIKYRENLTKSLSLIEYLDRADLTYSWSRSILREDILRLLDEKEQT